MRQLVTVGICISEYVAMQRQQLLLNTIEETTATLASIARQAGKGNGVPKPNVVADDGNNAGADGDTEVKVNAGADGDTEIEEALTPKEVEKKKNRAMQQLQAFSLSKRFSSWNSTKSTLARSLARILLNLLSFAYFFKVSYDFFYFLVGGVNLACV